MEKRQVFNIIFLKYSDFYIEVANRDISILNNYFSNQEIEAF